jgi:lactoylglutathione lyase
VREETLPYNINHIHLKSSDPKTTADWWVKAFNFTIESDAVRDIGDRFIRCRSEDGLTVNISSERTDEVLGPGDASAHLGLEHFGLDSDDLEADIARLEGLGAKLVDGPRGDGPRICFLHCPGDVRIELIQQ